MPSESGIGWSARSGVVLTDRMRAFLDLLSRESGVTLVVSSGVRSATSQASALRGKLAAGNDIEDLRDLYGRRSPIMELTGHPPETWGAILASQVARGVYLSDHMTGHAFDLSGDGHSTAEMYVIRDAARSLGAEAIVEDIGTENMHVHVEEV